MNRTHGTPLHRKHFNTRCNCPACRAFDNADTLTINNRQLILQNDTVVSYTTWETELVIDVETGKRYYRRLPYQQAIQGQPDRQRIRAFHNATTTVFY